MIDFIVVYGEEISLPPKILPNKCVYKKQLTNGYKPARMDNNLKNPRIIQGGLSVEISQEEVMTIEDVADYLRIPRSSVYKLAQNGELPGRKVGKHWRFHRITLIKWITGETTSSRLDLSEG